MSPRPHHPVDADDSGLDEINDCLDRIVDDVRAVLDSGGEEPLRARLSKLLPATAAPRVPRVPSVRSKPALTEQEAREIIRRRNAGESARDIARDLSRHVVTVNEVCRLGWEGWCLRRLKFSERERRNRHRECRQL